MVKKRLQYTYDAVGNRSLLVDPDGGRFTYAYDSLNRISNLENPQSERTTYAYDANGRRTLKRMANGTRASFTYDDASNVTRVADIKSDGTTITSFDYQYDKAGNRTSVLESDGSRVTWTYDNTYQLLSEHRTGSSGYRNTFTYDPAGNRTLKNESGQRTTYVYDAANQLETAQDASGLTTYTFDADGNQQLVQAPSGDRTTTVWDYENRTSVVQLPSGVRNTMAYHPDGLRTQLDDSTGTKKFVWDEQIYLAETNVTDTTQVVYTNEPAFYGNLISQRRGSTTNWHHYDALGSTRALTDDSRVITDTYLYDVWGVPIVSTGATVNPFQFVGEVGYYLDVDTEADYVRARIYWPSCVRWLSRDPANFAPSNAYVYADANPISRFDPDGEQSSPLKDWAQPGRFDVSESQCGSYPVRSCCCRDFTVNFWPSPAQKSRYLRVSLIPWVRTRIFYSRFCWRTLQEIEGGWHLDRKAYDFDLLTNWDRTQNAYGAAQFTDTPNAGPAKGILVGRCPCYCRILSVRQDFEVCAIGLVKGVYPNKKEIIGCVRYGYTCPISYHHSVIAFSVVTSAVHRCEIDCTPSGYFIGNNQPPRPPIHAEIGWDDLAP